VSDYGLDDRAIGVRSPAGAKGFSSNLCVQTGSETHPASCTMGTGGPFPGGKSAAVAWRWPLTPIYCRGWEWVGAIPPLPPSASMACRGTALPFYFHLSFLCISFAFKKRTALLNFHFEHWEYGNWLLNQVVHIVTTAFWRIKVLSTVLYLYLCRPRVFLMRGYFYRVSTAFYSSRFPLVPFCILTKTLWPTRMS
jgi:hypothetical protein